MESVSGIGLICQIIFCPILSTEFFLTVNLISKTKTVLGLSFRKTQSASDKVAGGNKPNDFTVHLANLMVVFHETDKRAKFSFIGVYPKQIVTASKETDHERAIKSQEGISLMILLYV